MEYLSYWSFLCLVTSTFSEQSIMGNIAAHVRTICVIRVCVLSYRRIPFGEEAGKEKIFSVG